MGSFSSKAAEKEAKRLGLEADQIDGTGAGGNITKGDVQKAAASKSDPGLETDGSGDAASSDPAAPETPTPPAPPPADPTEVGPPPVDPDSLPSKGTREIERTDANGAWHCPFCDHSQTEVYTTCQRCGAERDGDKVKAPKHG